ACAGVVGLEAGPPAARQGGPLQETGSQAAVTIKYNCNTSGFSAPGILGIFPVPGISRLGSGGDLPDGPYATRLGCFSHAATRPPGPLSDPPVRPTAGPPPPPQPRPATTHRERTPAR